MNAHFQTEIYKHTANVQLNTSKQILDAGKIRSLYLLSYENEDEVKYIFFSRWQCLFSAEDLEQMSYCNLPLLCSPAEII
jgi:hypothetical protein